jgi:hypothetical protein
MMRFVASASAAVCLALTACSSPVSGPDLEAKLREAGSSVQGLGSDLSTFAIDADSQMAAWTLIAEAREGGPLPLSRQLARRMDLAVKRKTLLVVGGSYPSLTRVIVMDALSLIEGKAMPGLVLVYVGSAESARDPRAAAGPLEIRFVQRDLP